MKSILKTFIDYSLFEKYGKEYFLKNKIIPIYEDNIYLKVAVHITEYLNSVSRNT